MADPTLPEIVAACQAFLEQDQDDEQLRGAARVIVELAALEEPPGALTEAALVMAGLRLATELHAIMILAAAPPPIFPAPENERPT